MSLVLLHGFARGPAMFGPLARLDAHAPWILGHGPEPVGDPTSGWEGEVERLVAGLPDGPLTLCGYSMGARLALAIAARTPARIAHLVLVGVNPGVEDPVARAARRAEDEGWAVRLEREGLEAFLVAWEGQPHAGGVARPDRRAHRAPALAAAMRVLGPGTMPDLWPTLAGLTMPVDLVAGARDVRFASIARRAATVLPRARLTLVPDAGHDVVSEEPAAVRALLVSPEDP